jgi:hypothetical protein
MALSLATTCAVAVAIVAGSSIAGASTRYRSGAHAQFASTTHLGSSAAGASSLHLTGPDVMASVVALMAVLAVGFLVVTFIRRRVSLTA